MLKKFLRDKEGQFAVITAICALPLFGGVAMAIDFSNLSRLRHDLKDSCDASNIEVAKSYMAGGKTKDDLKGLARQMFDANFDEHYLDKSALTLTLPDDEGNTTKKLELECKLTYETMFGPVLAELTGSDIDNYSFVVEVSTMKMKNVAEIALVLDNSGSMAWDKYGNTSGVAVANQRITLLKQASKQLITTMIELGTKIHQVSNPVKFSLVPFSASVNVGAGNNTQTWMDTRGVSPIHHEHLNWGLPGASNPTGYRTTAGDGAKLDASGQPLTRWSILNALKWQAGGTEDTTKCHVWKNGVTTTGTGNVNCAVFRRSGTVTAVPVTSDAAATAINSASFNKAWAQKKYTWQGCVEARPNGLDLTDELPQPGNPSSFFVPMFAPDEFVASKYGTSTVTAGYNNWWPDFETDADFRGTDTGNVGNGYWANVADTGQSTPTSTNLTTSSWWASTSRPREIDVAKYFVNKPYLSGYGGPTSTSTRKGQWQYFRDEPGPNQSCTTQPITPLTGNEESLHDAIDAMSATGNTNVPEGLAWGWRTVSSKAPFTEGVDEDRKDIDKVVIVLTDGANTYADLANSSGNDVAGNKTAYAAYGVTGYAGNGGTNGTASPSNATNAARLFAGTSASKTDHSDTNYQKAMDDRMLSICNNIKGQNIILMTVALDLDPANFDTAAEKTAVNKALETLTSCAGDSKTRKLANGDPAKLFWNAKSDTLDQTFREISDELSNLRFTM